MHKRERKTYDIMIAFRDAGRQHAAEYNAFKQTFFNDGFHGNGVKQ